MSRTVIESSPLEVFERHVLLGTWFSSGLESVQLMLGPNDLKGRYLNYPIPQFYRNNLFTLHTYINYEHLRHAKSRELSETAMNSILESPFRVVPWSSSKGQTSCVILPGDKNKDI